MLDLILAAVAFTLAVAIGLAVLYALTVLPFVWTLSLAEKRHFAGGRWGVLAVAGIGLGLLGAYAIHRSAGASGPLALLPLPLTFLGPIGLWLTSGEERIGGRPGAHQ